MSSYPSRNNRYNDSARQSHSRNSRLQSVNPGYCGYSDWLQFEHQEQNDEEDIVSFTDKIVALYRTAIIKQDKSFCILAKHVNIAVCILLGTFAQFDEQLEKDIFDFVIQQTILHTQDWPYEVDANLFRLILNVIDLADHDSCVILASSIFAANSRIWL
ncbi:unnamed protein product [Rotaria sp. Silwood1]|nr:unnamed protein product [Rotaria sp. Silwood1]